MSTKSKPKAKPQTASRVLETVYETAADLERLGFIDKRKMQKARRAEHGADCAV